MLPANLISALQALTHSGKPLVSASADPKKSVTQLEPGQQLQGTVQSKLSEGLFKVQIAGQTLQMRLPGNIQSGDVIRLEVLSTQPRITFNMIASTNPLSTPEQISNAARLLSNLADMPLERPVVKQLGNKAVWPADQPVPDTKLLAGALREALGKSGLFYESHQAEWVRGERTTNQLLEEPQNVLTSKNILPSSADQQTTLLDSNVSLPVTKELLHLVQQQLHTLEQHHVVWLGQVWPGQQMQWEIQGEPEHQAHQESERQWSTEMELVLPKLGDVHARLVFSESGLKLALHAADEKTVDLFNRALPQLKNSLADADITLVSALVEKS